MSDVMSSETAMVDDPQANEPVTAVAPAVAVDASAYTGGQQGYALNHELERGRILQRAAGEPFELFVNIRGAPARLAEFTSLDEAQEKYSLMMRILKPAVHDPFAPAALLASSSSSSSSSSSTSDGPAATQQLAMFDLPNGDVHERRVALKSLAGPSEELANKRRKLISQKGLRSFGIQSAQQRRLKGGRLGGGGGGGGGSDGGGADGCAKGGGGDKGRNDKVAFKRDVFVKAAAAAAAADEDEAVGDGTPRTSSSGCADGAGDSGSASGGGGGLEAVDLRVCALCGGDDGAMGGLLAEAWDGKTLGDDTCRDFDGQGHWMRAPLQMSKGRAGVWLHWPCALYSPQVAIESAGAAEDKEDGEDGDGGGGGGEPGAATAATEAIPEATQWYNVTKEVRRGRAFTCSACPAKGATLGCMVEGCKVNVHLPCAVRLEGWRLPVPWLKETNPFMCRKHREAAHGAFLKSPPFAAASRDLSKGLEREPVTWTAVAGSNGAAAAAVAGASTASVLPSGFIYCVEPVFDVEVPSAIGPAATDPSIGGCQAGKAR